MHNYDELYKLLYFMNKSQTVSNFADNMYWSISKASRKIHGYEQELGITLLEKDTNNILSLEGVKLLNNISEPYHTLRKIITPKTKPIGVDENLISLLNLETEVLLERSDKLIEHFELGYIDQMIVSEDYENEFDFANKQFVISCPVYKISHKHMTEELIFANRNGCPITKRLQVSNINIDCFLNQSLAICNVVKSKLGSGYTFFTSTLNDDIIIEEIEELTINFYKYSKLPK